VAYIFLSTVLGGAWLLALAVWPGVLEDVLFGIPSFCLSLPLLGCWSLLLVGLAARDLARRPEPPVRRRRWGLWSAAMMFGVMGLLWFHVPERIAFGLCYSELQALVDVAPADELRVTELDRQVGPYRVDRYGADRRGGFFFRTHSGPDGISPDRISCGFAFRPNGQGTPFGNARYQLRHLFGDWYVFEVSDDW
jgi:hypothetical protein